MAGSIHSGSGQRRRALPHCTVKRRTEQDAKDEEEDEKWEDDEPGVQTQPQSRSREYIFAHEHLKVKRTPHKVVAQHPRGIADVPTGFAR